MEQKEIVDIPESIQQICKEVAAVAAKNGLYTFSGQFKPVSSKHHNWGGNISFHWKAGRHDEDSNQISITSEFYVTTNIVEKRNANTRGE